MNPSIFVCYCVLAFLDCVTFCLQFLKSGSDTAHFQFSQKSNTISCENAQIGIGKYTEMRTSKFMLISKENRVRIV
jgi:hypothetical protein